MWLHLHLYFVHACLWLVCTDSRESSLINDAILKYQNLMHLTYRFLLTSAIITEPHRVGGNHAKTLILSTNIDQKSLETESSIAICRPTGDKWQSKTLFLASLIRVRRLLRSFSIAVYPVFMRTHMTLKQRHVSSLSLTARSRVIFFYVLLNPFQACGILHKAIQ